MPITPEELTKILATGENVNVEFKLCGNGGITPNTYETVCAFANRFGGDIFLGVDDATCKVIGVPEKAVQETVRNNQQSRSNLSACKP